MAGGRGARASLHLHLAWLCAFATTAWAHGGGGGGGDSDADADGGGEGKPDLRARGLVAAKLCSRGESSSGTAMMHFLADANETFADLLPGTAYPFAFMLACAGYVLTMLADCAISFVVARGGGRTEPAAAAGAGLEEGKLSSTNGNASDPPAADAAAQDHSVASMLRNASTLGDSVLLIAALCFHSVFEGIAIGVAETKADAWKALWTISLHKIFAAIAMGIALLRMLPDRPFLSCFGYAFAFAVSSPVGVGIGIVIDATTQGRVADWIFAVSMGLATGIFIYVSINHLLSKGYTPLRPVAADTPAGRLLAVVLGVAVIAVVMIWDT
ncbi:hypothetical protein OsJ_11245 [Oryza sativa Japonica Group]|uniref:Uncharacterized protein n=1 Tax=Oryza sativa subsp. japonica TaxID=39947 RepID=B9F8Z5_ORYSJ|nr:hypothetical protein OsJ_11245 [Oryza sativa Japonica Group]